MLLVVIAILLALWAVFSFYKFSKAKNDGNCWSNAKCGWFYGGLISVILVAVILIMGIWQTNAQYDNYHDLVAIDNRYDNLVERRDREIEIITSEYDVYPEFERDIFQGIDSDIILSYPQIRTNEILQRKVQQVLDLQDSMFSLRDEVISAQRDVFAGDDNPFVVRIPGLWPSWDDYFNGENPIYDGRSDVTPASDESPVTINPAIDEEGGN